MNILLVVPRLNIGGAESYTCHLALGLHQKGLNVTVVSGGGHLAGRLRRAGIRHYRWPIRWNYRASAWFIRRLINRHHIDLVHANSGAAGQVCALACRRTGTPWVMTFHGVVGRREYDAGIREAARFICVSRALRQRELQMLPAPESRYSVIYNGIDLSLFDPERFPERRDGGRPFRVGIISRLRTLRFKGHWAIMTAMAAEKPGTNWELHVIGKGRAYWPLRFFAWRLGLGKRVKFAGLKTDMPAVLAELDAVVLATNYETFGLVLAEAMAMERPTARPAISCRTAETCFWPKRSKNSPPIPHSAAGWGAPDGSGFSNSLTTTGW